MTVGGSEVAKYRFKPEDRVRAKNTKLGGGTVVEVEKRGPDVKYHVNLDRYGDGFWFYGWELK